MRRRGARGVIDDEDLKRQLSALDGRRAVLSEELAETEDHTGGVKRLEEVAALVEAYLRDLPELVGREWTVREYETVPAERTEENPLGIYTLTPESIRERTQEEVEGLREGAERERSARFRDLYEDLGLRATLDKDGTLEVRWDGGRGHAGLPRRCVCETTRMSHSNPRGRTRDIP